jgi:hypothetical protein
MKAAIVVSLLFSISLAQAGKTSETETVVRKSGVALEQEAIDKVEPAFPPIAKAARDSGAVKVEVTNEYYALKKNNNPLLAEQLLNEINK